MAVQRFVIFPLYPFSALQAMSYTIVTDLVEDIVDGEYGENIFRDPAASLLKQFATARSRETRAIDNKTASNQMHDRFAQYFNGRTAINWTGFEGEKELIENFVQWSRHRIGDIYSILVRSTEHEINDDELNLTGRYDAFLKVKTTDNRDITVLIEWKSLQQFKPQRDTYENVRKACIQLNLYRILLERKVRNNIVGEMWVFNVDPRTPTFEYEVYKVETIPGLEEWLRDTSEMRMELANERYAS